MILSSLQEEVMEFSSLLDTSLDLNSKPLRVVQEAAPVRSEYSFQITTYIYIYICF